MADNAPSDEKPKQPVHQGPLKMAEEPLYPGIVIPGLAEKIKQREGEWQIAPPQ